MHPVLAFTERGDASVAPALRTERIGRFATGAERPPPASPGSFAQNVDSMAPGDHMHASAVYVDQSSLAPDPRIHSTQSSPMLQSVLHGVPEMHPMAWHQNIDAGMNQHGSFGRVDAHAGQLATAGELEAGELQAHAVAQDVLVPTIGVRHPLSSSSLLSLQVLEVLEP